MTCHVCSSPLPTSAYRNTKYCSKVCSLAGQPPCSIDGCDQPRRAKGLCNSHYKRSSGGYRLYETTCSNCGAVVNKDRRSGRERRFCSLTCRDEWRWWNSRPLACRVPDVHPSRSTFVPDDHPSRVPIVCTVPEDHPSRAAVRPCAECGTQFNLRRRTVDRFCSRRCKARSIKVRRKGRAADGRTFTWSQVMRVFLLLDRRCAYCDQVIEGQPDPDHVVPLARGGSNGFSNILPACQPCNGDKRDLLLWEWADDRVRRGKPPVRVVFDRAHPAFRHLLPDAIASGAHAA